MQPIPFSFVHGFRRVRFFWDDVRDLYLRARYGWAPSDAGDLDRYLNRVLAGTLQHLADRGHGTPVGYPYREYHVRDRGTLRRFCNGDDPNDVVTDRERWRADLRRWAAAFAECSDGRDHVDFDTVEAEVADEKRRSAALRKALAEMTPWWEALWD